MLLEQGTVWSIIVSRGQMNKIVVEKVEGKEDNKREAKAVQMSWSRL